jgi:hypothetical protein
MNLSRDNAHRWQRHDRGRQGESMSGTSWFASVGWVKRFGLALVLLAVSGLAVRGAEPIVVALQVEDAAEIITSDLKRLRLAGPAEVRFAVTTTYIAQVFGDDLTVPRGLMRVTVISSARRVLGQLSAAEAVKPEAASAVVAQVDRDLASLGVAVESHTLRYTLVPPLVPERTPPR